MLLLFAVLLSCGGDKQEAYCGNGVKDFGEECDDGNRWNNDGCSSVCTLEIAHTMLYANVGINREVVPGYPGDTCSSVADILVIEGAGPDGYQLEHKELSCSMGYNGWLFADIPPGAYRVTMQLFDSDRSGNLTALTQPRDTTVDVMAGVQNVAYVDFTYRDFTASYTGNLKWRYVWSSGAGADGGVADAGMPDGGTLEGVGCSAASPPVSEVRLTLRTEAGQTVNAVTTLGSKTNGSQKAPCHDFGSSEAEVVPTLAWGIYELTLEGFNTSGSVIYCARRPLFVTNGEGMIFTLTGVPGACH